MDHRLINGEAGVGINNFIANIRERQHGKENDWLAAWDDHYPIAGDFNSAAALHIVGDGLAQFRQSRRRAIVRPSSFEGFDAGLNDVLGRIKVGLANFQVDDIFALTLQGARLVQHFEGSLGAQSRHALGQAEFVLRSFFHGRKSCHYIPPWLSASA